MGSAAICLLSCITPDSIAAGLDSKTTLFVRRALAFSGQAACGGVDGLGLTPIRIRIDSAFYCILLFFLRLDYFPRGINIFRVRHGVAVEQTFGARLFS